ncbi:MAG TPA: YjgP/YjgQ family permease [Lutibacter sp.]|nr:YjgP/YjgQ family permease [Lutibacter sp.]
MRIIDAYIVKRFLKTLALVISIILPIGVAIDISERIDKFIHHNELTLLIILRDYYQHFMISYGNMFLPLALFIAVILFTSKLASNTEIIAIHSAQISFNRLLYPFFMAASIVAVFSFFMNHYVVPNSNAKFTSFDRKYLSTKKETNTINNISLQLGEGNYIFIKSFWMNRNKGSNFMYEHYKGTKLKYRLKATNIKWIPEDSIYRLNNFSKRYLQEGQSDQIVSGKTLDTLFNFYPKDLYYIDYLAKEMPSPELNNYIKLSEARGVKNLNPYKVELQKRTSLPFSSFILTMIAVALASRKRRGGIGVNLAIGIGLAFLYIFFMKITEVLGAVAGTNSLLLVWIPNLIFGILAFYLYWKASKQ